MKNNNEALEFLRMEHAMHYEGLDDEMPDDFDEWLAELDEIAWVTIMSRFAEKVREETLKKYHNQ